MNKKNKQQTDQKDSHFIVGIGASAGGIKALEQFFEVMPNDSGLSFVVIQHMSPELESRLPDLIQRKSKMPVDEIRNNQKPRPNHIYITPPNYFIKLAKERFNLKKTEKTSRGVRHPFDYFLRSLAIEKRNNAIGIILTGTGTDGTLGIKEIKNEGGYIMVQSPESAEFPNMPNSAIETGLVDLIVSIDEMPDHLLELCDQIKRARIEFPDPKSESLFKEVFRLLHSETGYNFSNYKKNTLFRRVRRRMVINRTQSLGGYIKVLENNPTEIGKLFKELLIGVTSFFREIHSFYALKDVVFPKIIQPDNQGPVRIWVAGCSTGEEAYSLAILISEFMEEKKIRKEFQVFASDIDKEALEIARLGRYHQNIESDVPLEYLKKYFTKEDNIYQINETIRDVIVFAEHSVIKDPPYSKLDLISCRNLLIYLEPDIQKHILNTFHYALNPKGYLFLGSSEGQSIKKELFTPVNSKDRIFQKAENQKAISEYLRFTRHLDDSQRQKAGSRIDLPKKKMTIREFAEKTALRHYLYPFILIDKDGSIYYSLGKCEDYFTFQTGEPTNDIVTQAKEGLKVPLTNALRKLNTEDKAIEYDNIKVVGAKGEDTVRLRVEPVNNPDMFSNLLVVTIKPISSLPIDTKQTREQTQWMPRESDEYIKQLEQELEETREYLRNVIEDLANSNEELKSSNEEAQSTNEELQSANEELESSKEEMQSLNEELETSNKELQRKIDEVSRINDDLNNFLKSTQIGTLFLDKSLNIQRFTPQIKKIINLMDSDMGRSIEDFGINSIDPILIDNINKVLESLIPVEKEVSMDNNRQYWMRIMPYRTRQDKIDGVVLTFTDITEKNRMIKLVEKKEKKYKLLFDHMNNGFALFDPVRDKKGNTIDYQFIEVNRAFEKIMEISWDELKSQKYSEFFTDDTYREEFLQDAHNAFSKESIRKEHYFKHLGKYFRVYYYTYEENSLATLWQDITGLKKQIETQQHLASIVESSDDAIFSESPEGKILSWNEGAVQLYGYSEKEALGKKATSLFADPEDEENKKMVEGVSKGDKIKNHETKHKKKDGSTVPISITKSPIKDPNNKVVAISNTVKDITLVKQREKELLNAKEATEQAATLKATFLANMSHEIRTPLNSILGFTRILHTSVTDEQQKKQINTIYQSGKQLLHLINDLVDVARLEAHELPVNKAGVNLNRLLTNTQEQFEGYRYNIDTEQLDFKLIIPDTDEQVIVNTDKFRLQQILYNLISNAFKYTSEGKIEFGYTIKDDETIEFFVKDTGHGISPEDQKIIFDRFKQVEKTNKGVVSGTGLGLTIAKKLSQLLGGDMWLKSEPGKGTCFYFTIPYEIAEEEEAEEHDYGNFENKANIPQYHDKNILIAEDDAYSREMLRYFLQATKATLHFAEDGVSAVKTFNEKPIDVILLDIRLPKKTGYQVTKEIKEKNPGVIVIAQSAYAMCEEKHRYKEHGFDDYITKPVDPDILYSLLQKHLG